MNAVQTTGLAVWELLSVAVPLAFIVVLFFVVRGAVSSGVRTGMSSLQANAGSGQSAREVLDRRYASGEMTREEYLAVRNDIARDNDA